jgi:hypothetical protein
MSCVKKLELLKDVVHVEYDHGAIINIQIMRDGRAMIFHERTACLCKCKTCEKITVVFSKSGQIKCAHCCGETDDLWSVTIPMFVQRLDVT